MLVLGRKIGEQITIKRGGEVITIRVCEIRGGKCRLGITADKDLYTIHRDEIWAQIEKGIDARRPNRVS